VPGQGSDHTIDIEVLHGQAEVVDVGWFRAGFSERQEVRSVADAEKDLSLVARLYGHAEHRLVEIQRALQVRYGECDLMQTPNPKRSGLPLAEQTAGERQPRQGEKQASAGDNTRAAGRHRSLGLVGHGSVAPLSLIPKDFWTKNMMRGNERHKKRGRDLQA